MILRINGQVAAYLEPVVEVTKEGGGGIAGFVQDKFMDYIVIPVANWCVKVLHSIWDFIVANSVDFIEIGIIVCAIGIMVSPLIGKSPGVWAGRAMLIAFVGAVLRILT